MKITIKNIVVITLILISVPGCTKEDNKIFIPKEKVIISGKIENYSLKDGDKTVSIRVPNILILGKLIRNYQTKHNHKKKCKKGNQDLRL